MTSILKHGRADCGGRWRGLAAVVVLAVGTLAANGDPVIGWATPTLLDTRGPFDPLVTTAQTGWAAPALLDTRGPFTWTITTDTGWSDPVTFDSQDYTLLQVQINGSGTLSHTSGWYPVGSTQNVSSIPDYGWLLTGWAGDVTAGHTVTNMDLVMNRAWSLVVSFSDDPDGDGLKNVDEWSHGSDPWNPDTDGDGFDDRWEVDHSWNPTVPDPDVLAYILAHPDVFGVYSATNIGSLTLGALFIGAVSNGVHLSLQLETSPDLLPTVWTNAGPPVEWSMPALTNKAYYRVGVRE